MELGGTQSHSVVKAINARFGMTTQGWHDHGECRISAMPLLEFQHSELEMCSVS
jgi:hypothetical protein